MKPNWKLTSQLTAAIVLGLALVTQVSGQRESERDRLENERDLELRSWNFKMLSLAASKGGEERPRAKQALAQLQEDFRQIQTLNKSLGRAAIGSGVLDLRFVSKSLSEMKKRAERLNFNLKLPEPEASTENLKIGPLTSPVQLKPSLLKLVRLVFNFVDNPFFKEASVVDTNQTRKARRDLENIIELSEQLKKDSERFDKASREKRESP
ncbi:MAG: hypothetical protein ACREBG_13605 [Pyrinomonadaceae bacterium]